MQVIEKKFDIDGKKDFYFSSRFLECAAALSEKQKFQEIKKAAESVNELFGGGDKLDKKAETRGGRRCSATTWGTRRRPGWKACARSCTATTPPAKEEFTRILREKHVEPQDTVQVAPATVRRMESSPSARPTGWRSKSPSACTRAATPVEFINNPDGTISLLIKNIEL